MSLLELADLMSHKLADFTRAHRNAYQALNLDGGGSSTMVVRRDVVNRPSEPTGERQVANSLLLVAVPEEVRGSL
jgi:exopolysaccharide biosynthesis protein